MRALPLFSAWSSPRIHQRQTHLLPVTVQGSGIKEARCVPRSESTEKGSPMAETEGRFLPRSQKYGEGQLACGATYGGTERPWECMAAEGCGAKVETLGFPVGVLILGLVFLG
ncbi:hypothetical protein E1A91_A07G111900v1 [Gossypium mustelinum]|uniref:Uncharacterized protein n=2 Tax=Gossypium TaxID=3633 RepID=A0A5D2YIT4_GOSMU|nr:hypothetical protein ES288_A07G117800v1 [Gossypium darwinii]TYJ26317.1 hypothetical protein E1A91_A07G111900v1 [Gossypium mustelinum]